MTDQLRRTVPRQPADWFGFYKLDGVDDELTRCCRVLDISPLGAGLELFAIAPEERVSGPITVTVELRGDTRNCIVDEATHIARVGVEFSCLTEGAKRYIRRISGVTSRW
jgi:hypothetical protein